MPSPFPGMDPWLESADIWPDFHDRYANELSALLNQTLPAPYYARLEKRPEIGVVDDDTGAGYRRAIVPDVSIIDSNRSPAPPSGVATATTPRTELSPCIEVVAPDETGRHLTVEIRDPQRGHRLVTFIEILSPANKTRGPDRRSYEQKLMEIFDSDANLIEIDLLRAGARSPRNLDLDENVANRSPRTDYLVLVNRAWTRTSGWGTWQIFPVSMRETLPVIPVPLREGEAEVPLDLQYVFHRAYDSGPYHRGAVDYDRAPHPPLTADAAAWASELLASSEAEK